MSLNARTSALLSRRPRSLLRADTRPGFVGVDDDGTPILLERRRADCARLAVCEEMWIEEQGTDGGNARCPLGCRSYSRRP